MLLNRNMYTAENGPALAEPDLQIVHHHPQIFFVQRWAGGETIARVTSELATMSRGHGGIIVRRPDVYDLDQPKLQLQLVGSNELIIPRDLDEDLDSLVRTEVPSINQERTDIPFVSAYLTPPNDLDERYLALAPPKGIVNIFYAERRNLFTALGRVGVRPKSAKVFSRPIDMSLALIVPGTPESASKGLLRATQKRLSILSNLSAAHTPVRKTA